MLIRSAPLAVLFTLVGAPFAFADSPPLWGKLAPGPHGVGFKSLWELDYSRRYNIKFDDGTTYATGKAPRPILINMWYPAKRPENAKPMSHRGYLEIVSADPRLAKFATKLAEYEHQVIAKEVIGKPAKELNDREKQLLQEFLDTPTACVRDAEPTPGPFPLVIYHAGAGSSFEDNSVLCEFLASHGFVVIGSAFNQQDGSSFNTDNRKGSAGDLRFLIAFARRQTNVDWNHIGLVGHSAGAQASLMFRSQPATTVDAVVSLDTTQDYRGVADPMWSFTPEVLKNGKNFDCPLLMVAGPNAFFELADTLQSAERYYLTIDHLGHNDYILQGHIHNDCLSKLQLDDPKQTAETRAREKAELDKSRAGYQALCEYILRFFAAKLKGDAAAKEFLAKQYRDSKIGDDAPHVEYMPIGRIGPDAYRESSTTPPTPRQLRPYLKEHGSEKTIALYRKFRKDFAAHPIFSQNFELFLVSDLLDRSKTADAIAFRDYFRESDLDCDKIFLAIANNYHKSGLMKPATIFYQRMLQLDPSNREAAERLTEIERERKK